MDLEDLEEGLDEAHPKLSSPFPSPSMASPLVDTSSSWQRLKNAVNRPACTFFGAFAVFFAILFFVGLILVFTVHPLPPPPPPVWDEYRLPIFAVPQSYAINFTVDLAKEMLRGRETIRVAVLDKTDFVVVHAAANVKILRAFLARVPMLTPRPSQPERDERAAAVGEIYLAQRIIYNAKQEHYILQWRELEHMLGQDVLIGLDFETALLKGMRGAYLSTYLDSAGATHSIVATQFEATDARAAFPCFDEPQLKAQFSITIRHNQLSCLSNMPVLQTTPQLHGYKDVRFATTPPMSTYLVAFVVSDFVSVDATAASNSPEPIPVRVFARSDAVAQGSYAATISARIVDAFGVIYKQRYALPKLDLVAVPDFAAGAMENWGLMTFRETALLYAENKSSTRDRQYVAKVVAHEIAHQWFGDLVTMRWWHTLWLNEGFATYVEYEGVNRVEPSWNIWDHFLNDELSHALSVDELETAQPLSMPEEDVQTDAEIDQRFSGISYSKGACILRMLRHYLDSKRAGSFMNGIAAYLESHKYKVADTGELWAALRTASGADVVAFMSSWSFVSGYPLITCQAAGGKLVFSQRRYIFDALRPVGQENYFVPINYVLADGVERDIVLNQGTSAPLQDYSADELLIVNRNRSGYFRVFYPNLNAIIADVSGSGAPKQSDADVFGVIDDYVDFSTLPSLPVNISQLLTFCKAVSSRYTSSVAAAKATGSLLNLGHRVEGLDVGPAIRRLIDAILVRIGSNVVVGEQHDSSVMREIVARFAIETKAQFATDLLGAFNRIVSGQFVHPDLHEGAYRAAMMVPTDETTLQRSFDWLLNYYRTSVASGPGDRQAALIALGMSSNPRFVDRALRAAIDPNQVKPQDMGTLVGATSIHNWRAVWPFVKANWNAFETRYQGMPRSLGGLMSAVTRQFVSQTDEQDIRQFLSARAIDPDTVTTIVKTIQSNRNWLSRNEAATRAWFEAESGGR